MKSSSVTLRNIRVICSTIFVLGIAGMIITSVAGNNVGLVNTIGGATAISALVLLVATITSNTVRPEVFVEADAERVERQISRLVEGGADETQVRDLVRDATNLGRKS